VVREKRNPLVVVIFRLIAEIPKNMTLSVKNMELLVGPYIAEELVGKEPK
jgi:hypothetical protein